MNSQQIRDTFLGYFEEKAHRILPSSSVIPDGDKTLLFTNAGMVQFKDIFVGKKKPEVPRGTTVQKCIRAGGKHNDLDNVGYTARHLTFFEMLGNFSFRDYFKQEAIRFCWEFLTERLSLDAGRLWATVYHEDDEARELWRTDIGVPEDRIVALGAKDNYWSMGDVGPCGPCSEVLLDRGEAYSCGPDCGIGKCECDRFFEIWNLVFMQFEQVAGGEKVPLEKPSIDTGMGLERLALILQDVESVFETDVLRSMIRRLEEITGVAYKDDDSGIPHRVIADHVRALVFALADGAEASNDGRGYVLRRILRRAARYGRNLRSSPEPLLAPVVGDVLESMGDAYPEIRQRQSYIEGVIASEEERFGRTLDQGIERFDDVVARIRKQGKDAIPGKEAFLLYDTFGFPVDLVEQMAGEIDMQVDLDGYEREMAAQKERSRHSSSFQVDTDCSGDALDLGRFPETEFVGYGESSCSAELMAAHERGERWSLVLSRSPFYAESGGQVGDAGTLKGDTFAFEIDDTQKENGRWVHLGRLVEGSPDSVRPGAAVRAQIDSQRRVAIERNHTATHLLHAALRKILGDHVHQKGSLVDPTRLRFDVTHFSGISAEEREKVETLVLQTVAENAVIETFETDFDDAVKQGAMALFGEKYGDRVRVVRIGEFSVELCGGTHVERTGDIGSFVVSHEGSVSAGVRRMEALTERGAAALLHRNARIVEALALALKTKPDELLLRVDKLQAELKKLRSGKGQSTKGDATGKPGSPQELGVVKTDLDGGVSLHHVLLDDSGMNVLLALHDRLKSTESAGVFVLLSRQGGKVQVVIGLTPKLVKAGWDAREILAAGQDLLGARGGGRPDLVRGGGTNPGNAEEGLAAMLAAVGAKASGGAT